MTMRTVTWWVATAALLCLASCGKVEGGNGATVDSMASAETKASPDTVPSTKQVEPTEFDWVRNGEIVQYCLSLPKGEFKEDYDAAESKGEHVLRANSGDGVITFSGNPTDMNLEGLYAACLADVNARKGTEGLSHGRDTRSNTIDMTWMENGLWHQFRKWVRVSEGETVSFEATYPTTESTKMEPIVEMLRSQNPTCE